MAIGYVQSVRCCTKQKKQLTFKQFGCKLFENKQFEEKQFMFELFLRFEKAGKGVRNAA